MVPVLSVSRSVSGRFWRHMVAHERESLAIAQQLQFPELVARLLVQRGQTVETVPQFLSPKIRDFLPNPSRLKDMDKAAEYIAGLVMDNKVIGLLGDYDVDGATSAALLIRFFRLVGARAPLSYVPDRQKEGYGPNAAALRQLHHQGVALVLTLDCGIVAFDALGEASRAGIPVIIVDHHIAEPRLPDAYAVVNPNRLDDESGQGQLAAVGVAFLLAIAVNRVLRNKGWFASRPEPDLFQLLDLVAVGTICDVVPLSGLNRALVTQGLKVLVQGGNPGLVALADIARVEQSLTAYHVGYVLGPRINAGGRVGQSDLGTCLLATDDVAEAKRIAGLLDQHNKERREIEAVMLDRAIADADDNLAQGQKMIVVGNRNWHPGIVGIIASRLKDRYARPACAIAIDPMGRGRGSGRSIPGFHLGNAVIAAREAGLLIKGGGHAMAAGFEILDQNISPLLAFMEQRLKNVIEEDLLPVLEIDGLLQPGAADAEFCTLLEQLGPFGSANAEPVFVLPDMQVRFATPVGDGKHLRCQLAGADGVRIKGIAFRSVGQPLGTLLSQSRGQRLHLAGKIQRDQWSGGVQLVIEDAAPVG